MSKGVGNFIKRVSFCLWIAMVGCSGYGILQKQEVSRIPDAPYERIIQLENPEGAPDRTLAGVVHATGKATVCADYPRQRVIKSLDDLEKPEKQAFAHFQNYAIRDGDETLGYVSVPVEYGVNIWRRDTDPVCKYSVQILPPRHRPGQTDYQDAVQGSTSW
ncbi:MAG: hypothetical protein PHQ63_05160 [Smithellaceae bacterium]|nr:hypothetical protein [Smithellaceae bacterium]